MKMVGPEIPILNSNSKVAPVGSIPRLLVDSNTNPFCRNTLTTKTQKLAQGKKILAYILNIQENETVNNNSKNRFTKISNI